MGRGLQKAVGISLGVLMGIAYAVVSLKINQWALPGVTLYVPPPGLLGSAIVYGLVGGGIGVVSIWPRNRWVGIIAGGALVSAAVAVGTVVNSLHAGGSSFGMVILLIYTFLPTIVLCLPLPAAIRWGAGVILPAGDEIVRPGWVRLSMPVFILLLTALIASSNKYQDDALSALTRVNLMIRRSQEVSQTADLTDALSSIPAYLQRAKTAYTLEWTDQQELFPGPMPASTYGQKVNLVIVRFATGMSIICQVGKVSADTGCLEYHPGVVIPAGGGNSPE